MAVSGATSASQKSLGAFYTPAPMAGRLVEWAIREPVDRVLDPSFGGLVFLEAAWKRLRALGSPNAASQLFGCDVDEGAHEAAAGRAGFDMASEALVRRDFFELTPGHQIPLVEAVV